MTPIEAYLAQPFDGPPTGGVVVIHHMPGYDEATKEITRRFAAQGYLAICPNLYFREAPGASPDDAAAAARAAGGVPDDRLVGDVGGAAAYLRSLASSNGKVATIGYCSGGRQSFLAACSLDLDAAVDCYGAFVIAPPPEGLPLKIEPIVDLAKDLSCPLLGLFGAEDQYPSPDEVAELEQALTDARQGVRVPHLRGSRPRLLRRRPAQLPPRGRRRGWQRIWEFFGPQPWPPPVERPHASERHRALTDQGIPCAPTRRPHSSVEGSGKGAQGWFPVSDATVYFDHPVHASAGHTLNIDLINPSRGAGARVAVELDPASARALAEAILETLEAVPPGLLVSADPAGG